MTIVESWYFPVWLTRDRILYIEDTQADQDTMLSANWNELTKNILMLRSVQTLQKDTHATQCTNITKRCSYYVVYKHYKKIILCSNMTTFGHWGVSHVYFSDKCFLWKQQKLKKETTATTHWKPYLLIKVQFGQW